jgi:ATP-dependent Lhr-like helicase
VSSFDRLTPAMQVQIVNTLGFKELRPVQHLTIDAVLDGDNCVVLAPTAGGKTEAAFFPILSAMDAADWKPVSVLYLSPIRALLNNQDARVARYAETIGRRSFTWHGDTGQPARRRFLKEPADILLTTPESLEAMLMSAKVPAARLFAGLRAVIIDEIHAFAADDRGAHLAALLERLVKFCGSDVQRIGLSATVGNPADILSWVQGSSRRQGQVVSPPKPKVPPDLSLDYVGSLPNAAQVIAQLHRGKKRLVFVDSRRGAEELAQSLGGLEVDTFLIHGSLAASERKEAERAFAERQDCVIVSTSALELGIDVGDLDHVLQLDAPGSVASFLQRMGRTGRRAGTVPNCTFLATKKENLLQAAALLRLWQAGFVEPIRPSRRAFHILAHQIMALTIQRSGLRRGDWFAWLEGATPFAGMTSEDRTRVLDHMLEKEILSDQDGIIALGAEGEKKYGRRNFQELYAMFSTPRSIVVAWGHQEIGTVDAGFLDHLETGGGRPVFSLAGRPWEIVRIDWKKGMCDVRPSEEARAPRWSGKKRFLGYELSQAIREVLISETHDPWWSKRTVTAMAELRGEFEFLKDAVSPLVTDADGTRWWNYAGGSANLLLARLMESELGGRCSVTDAYVTWKADGRDTPGAMGELIRRLAREERPSAADALQFASAASARLRLSKFEPCLPQELLDEYVAGMLDVNAARSAVSAF